MRHVNHEARADEGCRGVGESAGKRFMAQGSGLRVKGSVSRVQSSGFRVQGPGFRVEASLTRRTLTKVSRLAGALGFRVQSSGFRVQGPGRRIIVWLRHRTLIQVSRLANAVQRDLPGLLESGWNEVSSLLL